jgi:hypothetical protein
MDYIHIAKQAAAKERCKRPRKAALHREVSATESNTPYYGVGFHILHCVHDRSYFVPCINCRRSKGEALEHLRVFLSKVR